MNTHSHNATGLPHGGQGSSHEPEVIGGGGLLSIERHALAELHQRSWATLDSAIAETSLIPWMLDLLLAQIERDLTYTNADASLRTELVRLTATWHQAFNACQSAALMLFIPDVADAFIPPLLELREREQEAFNALLNFIVYVSANDGKGDASRS